MTCLAPYLILFFSLGLNCFILLSSGREFKRGIAIMEDQQRILHDQQAVIFNQANLIRSLKEKLQ